MRPIESKERTSMRQLQNLPRHRRFHRNRPTCFAKIGAILVGRHRRCRRFNEVLQLPQYRKPTPPASPLPITYPRSFKNLILPLKSRVFEFCFYPSYIHERSLAKRGRLADRVHLCGRNLANPAIFQIRKNLSALTGRGTCTRPSQHQSKAADSDARDGVPR